MSDIWNNTCVLISNTGEVILSDPKLRGHNEAISYCGSKVGIELVTEQPMPIMLEILASNNHTILLNAGKVINENDIEKRTGYLALPNSITSEQLPQIENLKLILEEYESLTVWKLDNNKLKTRSLGNSNLAIFLIQEMIDEITNKTGIQK